MKRIPTIVVLLLFCCPLSAKAVGLSGLVADVHNGKSFVATNGNRSLEVILEGVDAPEPGQEFSDAARKHLADLVLGKQVYIEYAGMKPGGGLIAQVFLNNMNVGLQVIRDGVAWYDRGGENSLTDLERRVYAESEQAARNERRGMWENGSPMPPWEWRRAQTARLNAASQSLRNKSRGGQRGLSREDVLFTGKSGPSGGAAASRNGSRNSVAYAKPTQKPLNTPGQDYNYQPYLTQGRVSIVYFYADWCPSCREFSPIMDMVNTKFSDMQVLFMNISDWESPVTRSNRITFVPYLKIYDEQGTLVAEGQGAMGWLKQAVWQRERGSR